MTSHICQRVNTGESYIFYLGIFICCGPLIDQLSLNFYEHRFIDFNYHEPACATVLCCQTDIDIHRWLYKTGRSCYLTSGWLYTRGGSCYLTSGWSNRNGLVGYLTSFKDSIIYMFEQFCHHNFVILTMDTDQPPRTLS